MDGLKNYYRYERVKGIKTNQKEPEILYIKVSDVSHNLGRDTRITSFLLLGFYSLICLFFLNR